MDKEEEEKFILKSIAKLASAILYQDYDSQEIANIQNEAESYIYEMRRRPK